MISQKVTVCVCFSQKYETLFSPRNLNLIPGPQSYENEVMSVEDYTETGNYLSITRLILSVLNVTIVAKRHILETAFFS